jgi:hypothetical protein
MNATTACSGGAEWINYPVTETLTPFRTCTPSSLADVVAIVQEAEAANMHVHPFGSRWSFSDCAVTPDYLIDTSQLNKPIQTVQKALRPGQSQLVYHMQAGMKIQSIYSLLMAPGLALETMGGSSGQTIAGAISTGTHGGDLFMPPLADSVLALHLVGAGGTEYWIEPSPGITDPALLQQFVVPGINPQNIIYDTAKFNACLVSLGCMGVIYALVLRVRQAYDLIETTMDTQWQALVPALPELLRGQDKRFLQIAVSPYPDASNTNTCLVTTRSEAPPTLPAARPKGDVTGAVLNMILSMNLSTALVLLVQNIFGDGGLSDDQKLVKMVQTVLSQAPDQQPVMAQHYGSIMAAYWPPGTFRGLSFTVMDTTFGQPAQAFQPAYSAEFFFPSIDANGQMPFVSFVNAVIAAISAKTDTIFTGYVSLRFTGATRATLGMQQWPQTCAVELSSLQGIQNEQALYPQILSLAIQHGALVHWGQINQPFGGNATAYPGYANWRAVYATMSKNFTARTFENALSARWRLTTPVAPSLGGAASSQVKQNFDGRLEVFARGTDNALWHIWQQPGGWSAWAGLGGSLTGDPQAGINADGRLEVFARGTDNALWHNWQTTAGGAWQGWASLGGAIASDPQAGINADGRLEVFARGTDNALWHIWQQPGGWSAWASLGGIP